tara:strand:- start:592 stop:705 length:114 start_codon:yes stop_codon:yes gene_type:complete
MEKEQVAIIHVIFIQTARRPTKTFKAENRRLKMSRMK